MTAATPKYSIPRLIGEFQFNKHTAGPATTDTVENIETWLTFHPECTLGEIECASEELSEHFPLYDDLLALLPEEVGDYKLLILTDFTWVGSGEDTRLELVNLTHAVGPSVPEEPTEPGYVEFDNELKKVSEGGDVGTLG